MVNGFSRRTILLLRNFGRAIAVTGWFVLFERRREILYTSITYGQVRSQNPTFGKKKFRKGTIHEFLSFEPVTITSVSAVLGNPKSANALIGSHFHLRNIETTSVHTQTIA
jgi:hypothetical protein